MKKTTIIFLLLLTGFTLLFVSCQNESGVKLKQFPFVPKGASIKEAIQILGEPDGRTVDGEWLALAYVANLTTSTTKLGHMNIWFQVYQFKDGKFDECLLHGGQYSPFIIRDGKYMYLHSTGISGRWLKHSFFFSEKRFGAIKEGMTVDEVHSIIGSPLFVDDELQSEDFDLRFSYTMNVVAASNQYVRDVYFKDGKVVKIVKLNRYG